MDPTLEEKQSDQPQQEESKRGGISQGISTINNLARRGFPNPLKKVGTRVVAQVGRSLFTFLATSPWFWVVLVILIVVIFTFVIVMGFGGAPTPTPAEP